MALFRNELNEDSECGGIESMSSVGISAKGKKS
jgi:hypothetical protein